MTNASPERPATWDLVIERVFDAPRDLVFRAFTEPDGWMHWFCPQDFSVVSAVADTRVGGSWRSAMRSPEGEVFAASGRFLEVSPVERLAMTHKWEADTPRPDTTIEICFEEVSGGTRMTFSQSGLSSEESRDMHREGWSSVLENLALHIQEPVAFHLTKSIQAPLALVWRAFSEERHLAQWWGPKGFKLTHNSLDFRPGGVYHYCMSSPSGENVMWGRFLYTEIVEPRRIGYISSFSDETGAIIRAPFSESFPLEMLNSLRFEELEGRTIISLRATPHNASAEEREFFLSMHASMRGGFGGTLQQLEDYLASGSVA